LIQCFSILRQRKFVEVLLILIFDVDLHRRQDVHRRILERNGQHLAPRITVCRDKLMDCSCLPPSGSL
jgi:hypothetical protein